MKSNELFLWHTFFNITYANWELLIISHISSLICNNGKIFSLPDFSKDFVSNDVSINHNKFILNSFAGVECIRWTILKCSSNTLSPAWIRKLKRARKLPWLPFGSSWTSGQSSQWPLNAIPWRPQKMTVSTIDLIFNRFSFTCCALHLFGCQFLVLHIPLQKWK